jgi:hypothetical protein
MKHDTREAAAEYAISIKNRIQVGDLINHHGFLCVVTHKGPEWFSFETLYNGKPTGESFSMLYENMQEADPTPCWTTEQ